jgi:hypothetical protein
MKMKWTIYFACAIFVGYFLVAKGAPPVAVAAGILAAGGWTLVQRKRIV